MAEEKSRPKHPIHPVVAELRQLRLDLGIRQATAADDMGASQGMLSGYENGATSPQMWFVELWAEYFGRKLVLERVEVDEPKAARRKKGAEVQPEIEADPCLSVQLTRYQIALAMGMIIAARRDDGMSAKLGEDLQGIADALARAL